MPREALKKSYVNIRPGNTYSDLKKRLADVANQKFKNLPEG